MLQPRYADSDLVYCNQEVPTAGEQLGISYYPTFNAPDAMTTGMQDAGCNVIGLANNHMADMGQQGIDITRGQWDDLDPLLISGANRDEQEQQEVSVTTIDGVDVSFFNVTDLSNGVAEPWALDRLSDTELVESLMAAADEAADVQIVAVHWGDEYSTDVNDHQREMAQWLVDLGADVIIGTHPHVLWTLPTPDCSERRAKWIIHLALRSVRMAARRGSRARDGAARARARAARGTAAARRPGRRPG